MYEFPVNAPILQELFDPEIPNSPALWAVLKGNHTGKALVDSLQHPSQCVIRTDAALTYFSSQTSQAFLDEAVAWFREVGDVWLILPSQTPLRPQKTRGLTVVERLEFYGCDADSESLAALRKQLPDGYSIRRVDGEILERCEWRAEMEFYAGSLENFLLHGLGFCMMRGTGIVAEAYASALGKTKAEIGAITHEAFRGRGYAPIACAYLIEACKQKGYEAYWSCDADNPASIRVAQKLGFQHEGTYRIYDYDSLS